MANMELIQTKTVGTGGAAYIEFTGLNAYNSIYTDLYLLCSIRSNQPYTADNAFIQLNGSSSSLNWKNVYSTGSGTPPSQIGTDAQIAGLPGTGTVTNSFGNQSFYIANFAGSSYKLINGEGSLGNTSTRGDNWIWSTLWSDVAAITSIKILPSAGLLIENSSISLYGIKKDPESPKAIGGIVSQDASYWYHMFPFSSTFTPTQNITCDYLVIAGGGSGANAGTGGGGGGAGGLRSTVTATGGGGSLESALSLTASTNYTVTIGAGGAQPAYDSNGNNGSNTVFATITSIGGGAGAKDDTNGFSGGSGGGAGGVGNRTGGAYTANQGYAGGNSLIGSASNRPNGGGGGAGAAGANGITNNSGAGGNGVAISALATATYTGVNNYYAGGGGGGIGAAGSTAGLGGSGGGGNGNKVTGAQLATAGAVNTGGGGGGIDTANGGGGSSAGGSGLVIVRYAK